MIKRKVTYWIVFFLLIVPIGYLLTNNWMFVKYLLRDWHYFQGEFKMIDPSKEIMRIKIGDYVANIPSNYFWRNYVFNGAWWNASSERIESDVVNLEVTWPDLKPWSPETNELFREPGTPRTISISIRKKRNEDWPFHFFKNFRQYLERAPNSSEAPGLLHFIDKNDEQDIYLEFDEPKLGMIKIICDLENSGIPSPSCTCPHSVFMDKYHIEYTFNRAFLSKWHEIDFGIKRMFTSFIVIEGEV